MPETPEFDFTTKAHDVMIRWARKHRHAMPGAGESQWFVALPENAGFFGLGFYRPHARPPTFLPYGLDIRSIATTDGVVDEEIFRLWMEVASRAAIDEFARREAEFPEEDDDDA